MRQLLFMTGSVGLLLLGLIAHADQQARPNYHPLKEGSKWQYRVEAVGKGVVKASMHAAKIEKIDNVDLFRMETIIEGQVVATEHLTSDDRGIFRHRYMGQPVSKPICLLKYPVTPGESWRDEVEIGGTKATLQFKVGKEEEVQVPAGKFQAVSIRLETETAGTKVETTYWFAANVGIVKQTAEVGGLKMTMELEKYELVR